MVTRNKTKQTSKASSYKANRREKEDRRSFRPAMQFPIIDSIDRLIKNDRRHLPDRRIANIRVKEHQLHFGDELFKKNKVD